MCGAEPLPRAARCQIRSSAGYAEIECGKHDLRVSPGVAPAGFQEMSPAFALDVASRGDAVTGINRADSANGKPSIARFASCVQRRLGPRRPRN